MKASFPFLKAYFLFVCGLEPTPLPFAIKPFLLVHDSALIAAHLLSSRFCLFAILR